jgi:hypothetical protein
VNLDFHKLRKLVSSTGALDLPYVSFTIIISNGRIDVCKQLILMHCASEAMINIYIIVGLGKHLVFVLCKTTSVARGDKEGTFLKVVIYNYSALNNQDSFEKFDGKN